MKVIKHKINSKKLFELHLIKSKTYESLTKKKNLKNLPNKSLSDIMVNFKKSLNIIFKYHKNNKRILFIGIPKEISTQINLNTIHTSISHVPQSINQTITNNFILNSIKLNKYLFKDKKFLLSKTQKKPELIIIFKHTKNRSITKESRIAKIPIIEFNYNLKRNEWDYSYNIPGHSNINKNSHNIFFIILNSLFNKSYMTNKNNK